MSPLAGLVKWAKTKDGANAGATGVMTLVALYSSVSDLRKAQVIHDAKAARKAWFGITSGVLGVDPRLRRSLAALKGVDLELVVLVALEDQSLSAAAQLLGLTPAAAKSRYHRARTKLRTELDGSFLRDADTISGGES